VAKSKVIFVRCTPETFNRWRVFVAKNDFKDYEEALNALLDLAELYSHMILVVKKSTREYSRRVVY
jgi:hypothetical protein